MTTQPVPGPDEPYDPNIKWPDEPTPPPMPDPQETP